MSRDDEAMVEAVASAVDLCVDGWNGEPWSMAQEVARAVLSVPVVRDALARDAQVQVVLKKWEHDFRGDSDAVAIDAISNIYEDVSLDAGDRDDSEEQR